MNCYWCGERFCLDDDGNPEFVVITDSSGRNRKVDADCAALGEDYARAADLAWCEANGVRP